MDVDLLMTGIAGSAIFLLLFFITINGIYLLIQENKPQVSSQRHFKTITNQFETIDEVQKALRRSGLESSNLILGIDYTASNVYTGRMCYKGKNLHDLSDEYSLNPYQLVIDILGRTLEPFDEDRFIPTFGFGDEKTTDKEVFPFFEDKIPYTFSQVLHAYYEVTPRVKMLGPTNFAPIIKKAIEICQTKRSYHILVIISDGQVSSKKETIEAIVEASKYALSILVVGVGDGPWDVMKQFDNELPDRKFDNFQFVNFHEIMRNSPAYFEATFALHALMEIPTQFSLIKKLQLLPDRPKRAPPSKGINLLPNLVNDPQDPLNEMLNKKYT